MTASRVAGAHVYIRSVPEGVALAQRCEELGVRALWLTSGGLGPDSLTTFAVIGSVTRRLLLGTSIAVTYSRHPLVMAQQALAIAQVAPGRFRLGIGTSHRPTVEGLYGVSFERPLQQLREYTEVVRGALSGEQIDYAGERFTVRAKLAAAADVPIFLSALRPGSYHLAGTHADGAISWVSPSAFLRDVARPALIAGAREAGRDHQPKLVGHAFALATDERSAARALARERLVGYTRMTFYQEMFAAAGHPEARDGQLAEELVDDLALVGSEVEVAAGVRRFYERGCDEMIVTLLPGSDADMDRTLRLVGSINLA